MEHRQPSHEQMRARADAERQHLFMVVQPDACPVCEMHRGATFWPDEAPVLPIGGCLKQDCQCEYRLFDPNGPSLTEMLNAGIQAVRAGKMNEAQEWLVSLLQIDRYNEKAWLWLSGAADNDEDRIECILEVLNINPDNEFAIRGLSALESKGIQAPQTPGQQPDDTA